MDAFEPFELSDKPLPVAELAASLAGSHVGAYVSFEGRVRDTNESRAVVGLEYEAYPALSLAEGKTIVGEAQASVIAARCVHRVGRLAVGEIAIWIGVTASHREEAFQACRYIIDEVKRRVPIWKKEYYKDGSSGWIGLADSHASERSPTPAPFTRRS
jgi:molybdopterin synthase catalytic subunit